MEKTCFPYLGDVFDALGQPVFRPDYDRKAEPIGLLKWDMMDVSQTRSRVPSGGRRRIINNKDLHLYQKLLTMLKEVSNKFPVDDILRIIQADTIQEPF